MKTLKEINKGCDYFLCFPLESNLCPQCQALKEQMEGVIELLCFTNIACDDDCIANENVKRLLTGEKEE